MPTPTDRRINDPLIKPGSRKSLFQVEDSHAIRSNAVKNWPEDLNVRCVFYSPGEKLGNEKGMKARGGYLIFIKDGESQPSTGNLRTYYIKANENGTYECNDKKYISKLPEEYEEFWEWYCETCRRAMNKKDQLGIVDATELFHCAVQAHIITPHTSFVDYAQNQQKRRRIVKV